MDREKLAKRYIEAWNQKNVSGILKLMHPQASFYDAFWQETCSGSDLPKYFSTNFDVETYWYRQDDEIVATPNGLAICYAAFNCSDLEGLVPIFNGAEVITILDGLIMTVSDFYCDPNPIDLVEIAMLAEKQHGQSHIAKLGLSARTSNRIKRKLAKLADDMTVFLQPALTVTQLADHLNCSVMHLFHVLEEEMETTFIQFINESRARYATTLLVDFANVDVDFRRIAKESGFESVEEFRDAFKSTFNISADEYLQQFP